MTSITNKLAAGLRALGFTEYVIRGEAIELVGVDASREVPARDSLLIAGEIAIAEREAIEADEQNVWDDMLQAVAKLPTASDRLKRVAARRAPNTGDTPDVPR